MSRFNNRKQFRCNHPGCNKVFNRRDYLERHATNHLSVKPFSCALCNRNYSRKDLYDNHLRTKVHAKSLDAFTRDETDRQNNSMVDEIVKISNQNRINELKDHQVPGPSGDMERIFGENTEQYMTPLNGFAVGSQLLNGNSIYRGNGSAMIDSQPLTMATEYAPPIPRFRNTNEPFNRVGKFSAAGLSLGLSSLSSSSDSSTNSPSNKMNDTKTSELLSVINEWIDSDLANNKRPIGPLRDSSYSTKFSRKSRNKLKGSDSKRTLPEGKEIDMNSDKLESTITTEKKPALNTTGSSGSGTVRASSDEPSEDPDSRYDWFFDDKFSTNISKLGYDRCYSDAVDAYSSRLAQRRRETVPPHNSEKCKLSPDMVSNIVQVIGELPEDMINIGLVELWISTAWKEIDSISGIIHEPTFVANDTDVTLLSVLCLIGMSLSSESNINDCAKRSYAQTFLNIYESFLQNPPGSEEKLTLYSVNRLQAMCLILRFEKLFLHEQDDSHLLSKTRAGKYATDIMLWLSLNSLPHAGNFGELSNYKPIWASINKEGYMFHSGVEPEAQWREWILMESAKRTVHFALYCDSIATLSTSKPNPVSIFNMDIYMISPEPLWISKTASEFFYVNGPSNIITDVPYLGLIKSLIKFPRVASYDNIKPGPGAVPEKNPNSAPSSLTQNKQPWSLFSLKVIAHGLIMIVGKLSGLVTRGDEMLDVLVKPDSKPTDSEIFASYDRNILSRLYRGLDVWYHYFSAAYGDVTDRILNLQGTMCMPIREEFETSIGEEDNATPHYALIIVLCHYSSFIFVHEDLPVVVQAASSLRSWIEKEPHKSMDTLLAHLYIPLYTKWIKTYEAKGLVNACILYLAWSHAISGEVQSGNHLFLSAVIYLSSIVIWLYDFAYDAKDSKKPSQDTEPLVLENFQFMDDAIQYLHSIYKNASGGTSVPIKHNLKSVILLGACLLYKRTGTLVLVKSLIELLNVMDPEHTSEQFADVVKKSSEYYEQRVNESQAERKEKQEKSLKSHEISELDNAMFKEDSEIEEPDLINSADDVSSD